MNAENLSLMHPSCWPLSFTIRIIIWVVVILSGLVLLSIPQTKRIRKFCIIFSICCGVVCLLIIGTDISGTPVENLFGFNSIESACYYASKGTVVETVEGTDSTLVVAQKKTYYGEKAFLVGEIAVYTKKDMGWRMVNQACKERQIAMKKPVGKYNVYLLHANDSADYYLILYDFYGKAEAVSCSDASAFNPFVEETGIVYWYARCNNIPKNLDFHIEIQDKDGA